ncbi:NYN domain-containing protein [Paenibacillus validus]|uniref:NYN domain-containing protein n=1 Tax=Paenibacillus validus TaxID=44253 RepID=A0A7X2ZEN1_9BACL|nr:MULTISPECIES: NYN domain-containing protein [Paenibacillus]MED4600379.1 NYN domain-containing protein [Paenibacillus validus]MED4606040.1 NYN domain-containing protein [Paenibacillus validus]MUG73530.1 NYN domain-containing protein [Paenibacillus validus]
MIQEILIVDGYNIIGAWPELQKLKEIRLEEARDRLIQIMAEYQSYSGMKVILVFDAYFVPGLGGKYTQSKLPIYFTKEKETADELIERLVVTHIGRRKQIYVATSDMTEQHVIFGKGAYRVPASELLVKVRLARQEIRRKIKDEAETKRNTFDSRLSDEQRKRLEDWRRER